MDGMTLYMAMLGLCLGWFFPSRLQARGWTKGESWTALVAVIMILIPWLHGQFP